MILNKLLFLVNLSHNLLPGAVPLAIANLWNLQTQAGPLQCPKP
ncbi:hypothetical protein KC19_8G176500 [Ceratodon purpureus]|uniref:Uncharacterized protein n=1 Tax=Ceratodon purpureus TaxID=3225 RepID=A0A8T0H259_CERPU|nr:hypothetical protein KC19_8G176500 [Ceratodon purpureus]